MLLAAWLTSCASAPLIVTSGAQTEPPKYSLVISIHGDANYVYHDTVGIAHYANEEALAKAHIVARSNPDAEVFIFHDKPLTRTLLFFKQRDGEFYYYRNGQLLATHPYWRDLGEGAARFAAQGSLYNQVRWRDSTDSLRCPVRMFMYFGHEIPEMDGLRYDASYPESILSVAKFSKDLLSFSTDDQRFDLFLMSTCFNGTPHSVAALLPHTLYLIASPTNLHLSYFDIAAFEHLEKSMINQDIRSFARFAAEQAFKKLSANVQTVVSVAVYDMAVVQPYMESVHHAYTQAIQAIQDAPVLTLAHCDCAELAPFKSPLMSKGVTVFYRPAQFGSESSKLKHSGWSCWKLPN